MEFKKNQKTNMKNDFFFKKKRKNKARSDVHT